MSEIIYCLTKITSLTAIKAVAEREKIDWGRLRTEVDLRDTVAGHIFCLMCIIQQLKMFSVELQVGILGRKFDKEWW